jgi:hypothetical protein
MMNWLRGQDWSLRRLASLALLRIACTRLLQTAIVCIRDARHHGLRSEIVPRASLTTARIVDWSGTIAGGCVLPRT